MRREAMSADASYEDGQRAANKADAQCEPCVAAEEAHRAPASTARGAVPSLRGAILPWDRASVGLVLTVIGGGIHKSTAGKAGR